MRSSERMVYSDGSGHVALLVDLDHEDRPFTLLNTHVKWQAPDTPLASSHGLFQTSELLDRLERDQERRAWILCGDFNARPETEIIQRMVVKGLHDPFAPSAYTANANGQKKKIDYIFTTADFAATARPLPSIDDTTPLPAPDQPSDHLAIVAELSWS